MSRDQEAEAEQLLDMEDESEQLSASAPPAATLSQGQRGPPDISPPATPTGRQASVSVRDCTYTAICKFRISERVAPNLMGGELLKAGDCGSLYCDGDSRYVLCFTKFDFGMKQNIMFSFNPNSWECRCCPGKVLPKQSTGSHSEPSPAWFFSSVSEDHQGRIRIRTTTFRCQQGQQS